MLAAASWTKRDDFGVGTVRADLYTSTRRDEAISLIFEAKCDRAERRAASH